MNKLAEKFKKELRLKLKGELGLQNIMAVPKVEKIIINIGLGQAVQDKKRLELAANILERISGQKPVMTKARKSISNFKIREGNIIGAKVTLRGQRMYDFLEKLIHSALPRFKDFYGLNSQKGFDGHGNYTLGLKEHIVFPEIGMDDIDKVHGLEVTLVTSAQDNKEGLALLKVLGFPFKKNKK